MRNNPEEKTTRAFYPLPVLGMLLFAQPAAVRRH